MKVKRVCYAKKNTPKELREYYIVGDYSGAVGTLTEIAVFLKKNGINEGLEVVE